MSEGKPKTGSLALSWLVRCWEEPREQSQEDPVLRGFVRDLKTGKERYLSDPRELGEILTRELREAGEAEKPAEDEPEGLRTGD